MDTCRDGAILDRGRVAVLSADRRRVAISRFDGSEPGPGLVVLDGQTGEEVAQVDLDDPATALAIEGDIGLVGGLFGSLTTTDLSTGEVMSSVATTSLGPIVDVCSRPDGTVVVVSEDRVEVVDPPVRARRRAAIVGSFGDVELIELRTGDRRVVDTGIDRPIAAFPTGHGVITIGELAEITPWEGSEVADTVDLPVERGQRIHPDRAGRPAVRPRADPGATPEASVRDWPYSAPLATSCVHLRRLSDIPRDSHVRSM